MSKITCFTDEKRLWLICVVVVVVEEGGRREETNRIIWSLIPSEVSLRIAETEQLYQVKRMFGGIGNVLFATYSQS